MSTVADLSKRVAQLEAMLGE